MKKVIFLFLAVFTAFTLFGKVSNKQIAEVFNQNEKIFKDKFKDLDSIYPGQEVLINLTNDLILVKVKKGDNLHSIIKKILIDSKESNNPKNYTVTENKVKAEKTFIPKRETPYEVLKKTKDDIPLGIGIAIVFLLLFFSGIAAFHEKNENKNKVKL
jgi:hypothetical protein